MPKDLLAAAPRDLLAKKGSYPGEPIVKAAVGPAYEPGKALVKGYLMARRGVQDKIREFIPEGADVPVPSYFPNPIPGAGAIAKFETPMSPKDIGAEVGGLALDQLATLGLGKGAQLVADSGLTRMGAAEARMPGVLDRLQSMVKSAQARSAVSKLLPSADIATDLERGIVSGVQNEGANLIKKTKNPVDVVNKFRNEKQVILKNIDDLVTQNNQPVEPKFIATRARMLLREQIANSNPKDRKKIMLAAKDEWNWMKEQGSLDTMKAHERKKFLYGETPGIQRKQRKGQLIVASPEKDIVKDAFAQAYKEAVERSHPDIQSWNKRYIGVENGIKAASKMAESRLENLPIGQKTIETVQSRPNRTGLAAAVVRKFYDPESMQAQTGRIEKLSTQAGEALSRSRMKQAPRLLERFSNPDKEYLQQLVGPDDIEALLTAKEGPLAIDSGGALAGEGFDTLSKQASAKARLKDFLDPTHVKTSPKQAGLEYEPVKKKGILGNEKGFVRTGEGNIGPEIRITPVEGREGVFKVSRFSNGKNKDNILINGIENAKAQAERFSNKYGGNIILPSSGISAAAGLTVAGKAEAGGLDKRRLEQTESSGRQEAVSSKGAVGVRQVTEPALKDYNAAHPEAPLTMEDIKRSAEKNRLVSDWYLDERIPQLLKSAGFEVNEENILRAYNQGIGSMKKGRYPKETRDYVKRNLK